MASECDFLKASKCRCNRGYEPQNQLICIGEVLTVGLWLGDVLHTYLDIDECSRDLDNCNQLCSNTNGGFSCSCMDGFQLQNDNRTCEGIYNMAHDGNYFFFLDIDECMEDSLPCGANAQCTNTQGAFLCTCNANFEGDGFNCTGNI